MTSSQQSSTTNADNGATTPGSDYMPNFYIGYHKSTPTEPVTDTILRQAQNVGYDMLTTPVTTNYFHTRVLALVSTYLSELPGSGQRDELTDALPAPIISPLTPDDTTLSPGGNMSQMIVYLSPWIDLGSADPLISNISRQVLNIEIAYAAFCGVGYVIIPGPRSTIQRTPKADCLTLYARAIQEALAIGSFTQIMIHLPMYATEECREISGHLSLHARNYEFCESAETSKEFKLYDAWDSWNLIRCFCKYNTRLSVALEIPRQLPVESLQARWCAEPLRILCFTSSTFLVNKCGYPVLSKSHQNLITRFMRLRFPPWLLLCDVGPFPSLKDLTDSPISNTNEFPSLSSIAEEIHLKSSLSPTNTESPKIENTDQKLDVQKIMAHLVYLRYLQKNQPARSTIEVFGSGYQDYLQVPLQPLADNLESVTYEVFEKDPVKYDLYEKAMTLALSDWSEQRKPTSCTDGSVVIVVAGSGRGPLVTRALRASKSSGVPIELWAIEKNPNAYVLLKHKNDKEWGGVVNVVKSDMRAWRGPIRHCPDSSNLKYGHVDILVSELLGSFADNELSPECLDGVQHVLAPKYGISIPSSYSAHLTPIYAPRLHGEISQRAITDDTASETPYVVLLHAFDFLASSVPEHPRIQKCWEFVHPLPQSILDSSAARRSGGVSGGGGGSMCGGDGANEHNVRAAQLKFVCKDRGTVHGIAGYFEAVLYDGGAKGMVELSTRPDTIDSKSQDMISWFPIYFPLKNPLYFPDDSELEVSIWRQTDDRKVWYEWIVEAFAMIGPKTRMRLAMSDMGSSRKVGCLM